MNAPRDIGAGADPGAVGWTERNQRWIAARMRALHARMSARLALAQAGDDVGVAIGGDADEPTGFDGAATAALGMLDTARGFEPALLQCAADFRLSRFEADLLLWAAAIELDPALRELTREAQETLCGRANEARPSFALAVQLLAEPHWDAMSSTAPLRRWRLLAADAAASPTQRGLRIDERVLHHLCGVPAREERLFGIARAVAPAASSITDEATVQRIVHALKACDDRVPVAVLTQDAATDFQALRDAALGAAAGLGADALWLGARDLPPLAAELAEVALLVDREAVLTRALTVVDLGAAPEPAGDSERRAVALLAQLQRPALLLGAPDVALLASLPQHRITRIALPPADPQALSARALRPGIPAAVEPALRLALQQFRLTARGVDDVLEPLQVPVLPAGEPGPASARGAGADSAAAEAMARHVWQACRAAARGGLDALAQRVESEAELDDLVLPPAQMQTLREIAQHLQHRQTVYGLWQMAGKTRRGRGLCALFAGESGTGKTYAAEAIANEARLDLYRIDLATVVSKYIGETEKNLARVFDAAERSGAVLLFDEADALFGKRSEVKDSHDRYANIEVAYLLQRVESYSGLAILTTNLRSAIDRAFLRRIRFVVQFPFPDAAARAEIWSRVFAPQVPTAGLDAQRLARLNLSGGSIRNVAIHAAFIAAARAGAVDVPAVQAAARSEFAKLERPYGDVRLDG